MTPVEIGADIAACALAASKLIPVVQAYWSKMPRWLSVAVPVIVAALPQIAAMAGVVHDGLDLVQLAVTSIALLVPGIAEAEKGA